jgi:hypothetical protein
MFPKLNTTTATLVLWQLCLGTLELPAFHICKYFLQLYERGKRMWKFMFLDYNSNFSIRTSFSPAVFTVAQRIFQISHSGPVFFSGENTPKGDSFLKMKYSAINSHFMGENIA